jgi:hypothetical protein
VARRGLLVFLAAVTGLVTGCGGSSGLSSAHSSAASGPAPVSEPVHYLPGGLRTVASRPVPGVGRVSIVAERYRFQGRVYFELDYQFHEPGGASGGSGVRVEGHAPLSWTFGGECPRAGVHASVAVVGLLRVPGDIVLAYADHRAHRLRTAAIPAYFHPGGVAAYTVLSEPPEQILVRTTTGRTVMREELGHEGPTACRGPSSISYMVTHTK